MTYYPASDRWLAQRPGDAGMSAERLQAAIDYHLSHESTWRRDFLTEGSGGPEMAPTPPALGSAPGGARTHPRDPGRSSTGRFVRGPEMAPTPPGLGAPRQSRGAPRRPDSFTASESGRFMGVADEPETVPPGPEWAGYVPGPIGPIRPRGGPNGLVLRNGTLVAEWGDTSRPDMSFSVAKSYLAVLAGLGVARGLIRSIDDPVRDYARDDGFSSPHNRTITWRHLLQQTSEWQGTLWGKPDTIDHNRDVEKSELGASQKGKARPLRPPGTVWEYNDVRVNRLSLSLLQVFGEPLADVVRRDVMDPIGASREWEWQPYASSWFELDGKRLPSVPGGSHWGGGLWMGTRDHARFGLLMLRSGQWAGRELIPSSWVEQMRRPSPLNPQYGFLWWLNSGRQQFPGAPESSFAARGAGSNVIWIDPEHDLVAVVRWIDKASVGGFIERVVASVEG